MTAPRIERRRPRIRLTVQLVAVSLALSLVLAACTTTQETTQTTDQPRPPETTTTAQTGALVADVSAPTGVEFIGAPAAGGLLFTITYTGERASRSRGLCWEFASEDSGVIFPILTSAELRSNRVGKPVPVSTSERTVECPAIALSGAGPDYVWVSGAYPAGIYSLTTVDNTLDFRIDFSLVPS